MRKGTSNEGGQIKVIPVDPARKRLDRERDEPVHLEHARCLLEGGYSFSELCLLYGGCHREEFLKQILRHFVSKANAAELVGLQKAVRSRAKILRRKGKKGRPHGHSPNWLRHGLQQARQKYVLRWSWSKIARDAGQRVDEANRKQTAWTLKRRVLKLANWLLPQIPQPPEGLEIALENPCVLANLSSLIGFPPQECRTIALGLAQADQSLMWFPVTRRKKSTAPRQKSEDS
jgi:hypothetical protein